jgi:2,3,4,5-tetrahydropyridine-2-carboxylate N-succinyltransferase
MAINIDREQLAAAISAGAQDRALIDTPQVRKAIDRTIGALDNGWLRCAEPSDNGWIVNDWVKTAIEMYFIVHNAEPSEAGPMRFYDKVPLKSMWENRTSIRIIPPAAIRFGAYLAPNTIFMPCFINIGAYVGEGTMVDTWATVGSCAQIGAGVHLSGGVGIGGVLEPPSARPVIIDDGAFIGSRSVVVEGVYVGKEAVLGAGTILTGSTPIIDVMQQPAKVYKGEVPARSVVIPGMQSKTFPGGLFGTPCALIIGERTESTDRKTSLNQALRDFNVGV